jgi:hypothetical protein
MERLKNAHQKDIRFEAVREFYFDKIFLEFHLDGT